MKLCINKIKSVCVFACSVAFVLGQLGCNSPSAAGNPTELEAELQGLGLEPHPYRGVWVDRGAVLNGVSRETAYRPSYAFKDPEPMLSTEGGPAVTGVFVDKRNAEASATTPLLSYLGLTAEAGLNYDWKIESNVTKLRKNNIRVDQFVRAELTNEFAATLDETKAFVAIEAVGNSEKLVLTVLNTAGGHAAIGDSAKKVVDMRAKASKEVSGKREYEDFTFASRPIFRAGGPGSAFTPERAEAFAAELRGKGIAHARAIGNTVIADQLGWEEVNRIWDLKIAYADTLNDGRSWRPDGNAREALAIFLADNAGVVALGQDHDYTIEIKNQSDMPVRDVKVAMQIPRGIKFVRSGEPHTDARGELVFTIGTLAAGQGKQLRVTARPTALGDHQVSVVATSPELGQKSRADVVTNVVR